MIRFDGTTFWTNLRQDLKQNNTETVGMDVGGFDLSIEAAEAAAAKSAANAAKPKAVPKWP